MLAHDFLLKSQNYVTKPLLMEDIMTGNSYPAPAQRLYRFGLFATLTAATALATASVQYAEAAPPVAGDTYVYRIVNGYNNETQGQISYRVDKAEADRIVMSVTTERPGVQLATTEIFTPDGKWLRHPVINRDQPVEYEFAPAYPSYEFPLEPGKKWSTRVDAKNPASGKRNSVRVDARVSGAERIRVPAGEFDTIKIIRTVYAGDAELPKQETTITETEWYAPSLGRSVRLASNSGYVDSSLFYQYAFVRGDWNIFELVSAPPSR
jgi:hypothetical protein